MSTLIKRSAIKVIGIMCLFASYSYGAVFTVTSSANGTNIDGVSLRWAIVQANINAGADTINFDLGPGPSTITLTSYLPALAGSGTTIDGFDNGANPGTPNTVPVFNATAGTPMNPNYKVVLTGDPAYNISVCLSISSSNNVIKGLVFQDFGSLALMAKDAAIKITAGTNNKVLGCYIGLDITGTTKSANTDCGIIINSANNNIGNGTAAGANLISGLNGTWTALAGILITGAGAAGNRIRGNMIGLQRDGESLVNGGVGLVENGVLIASDAGANNTIGGPLPGEGNVISGQGSFSQTGGVLISSVLGGNTVIGNIIGPKANGTGTFGAGIQLNGVYINLSPNNIIGGDFVNAPNIISGNESTGIYINGASTGTIIKGNIIGPNKSGTGNIAGSIQKWGILTNVVSGVTIGGSSIAERNIISGNSQAGIQLGYSAGGDIIKGNYIGVNINGTSSIPSQYAGIVIHNEAAGGTVGGVSAGEGNVISGNTNGISLTTYPGTSSLGLTTILGNIIGPKADGITNLGIQDKGIWISNSPNNTIGGTSTSARNIISANLTYGVYVDGSASTGNNIKGNYIGPASGLANITGASQDNGVYLLNGASVNNIGGYATGEANTIAFNTVNGVYITGASTDSNLVSRNLIYNTASAMTKAINLATSGNANYTGPVILGVSTTLINGTSPNDGDTVEVFLTDAGCGNAILYEGPAIVAGGLWSLNGSFNTGDQYIATVRNNATNNTSEFSICSSLPVQLLKFTVEALYNKYVLTQWTTSAEINNDYFTVERSIDGISFEPIGNVEGAGNSSSAISYEFTDHASPVWRESSQGWGVYYRLKQTDFNGEYTYYGPVQLKIRSAEGIKIADPYPDPAAENVYFNVFSSKSDIVKLEVVDILGRTVLGKQEILAPGENKCSLDLSRFTSGVYVLHLETAIGNYRAQKQFSVK